MQRRFLRIALASLAGASCLGAAVVVASCSTASTPTPVSALKAQPTISLLGANLADMSAVLTLSVYAGGTNDAGLLCNSATGRVYDTLGDAGAVPLVGSKKATETGCGSGDNRCFTGIEVPDSNTSPRVFSVIGYKDQAQTMPLAYGCATQMLDIDAQSTATVSIQLFPATTCGMAPYTLEPPETCNEPASDSGTPPICSAMCQTPEELLSVGTGDGGSKTLTGTTGQKSNPSFVWPAGMSNFVAVFGDTATPSGNSQISVRFLSDALTPTVFGAMDPVAQNESVFLPNSTVASEVPNAAPGSQKQPAAIETGGIVYVVFADAPTNAGPFAIQLRSLEATTLAAQQAAACPISETGDASPVSYSNPAIAFTTQGTTTTMLVGWQDGNGNVYVRAYTPSTSGGCGTMGSQVTLSTTNASQIALTGIPSGGGSFLASWTSGSDVVTQGVGASGNPAGFPTRINVTGHTASNPSIASIPSGLNVETTNIGAFAVVWSDLAPNAPSNATTIYALRFTNDGAGIDLASQISVSSNGGEVNPVITGSPTGTGSYVVTWVDNQSPSQVRARYLNATTGYLDRPTDGQPPYLQNPYDGTTSEFPVGLATGRTRVTPTVVVGGGTSSMASYSGQPYTAFGWVDNTGGAGTGVVARRWPSPQQFQQ